MAVRYPQLDREYIRPLWHRGDGRELLPREELEALIDKHGVDADLLAEALELALVKYRRLDEHGNKTALRHDLERLIKARAGSG